jgi:hypothetical protein
VNEPAALTSQRVLGAWEKLRRAAALLLVAKTAVQDLLPRAKHLLLGASGSQESRRCDFLTARTQGSHLRKIARRAGQLLAQMDKK